jgi:hypothetical protein
MQRSALPDKVASQTSTPKLIVNGQAFLPSQTFSRFFDAEASPLAALHRNG